MKLFKYLSPYVSGKFIKDPWLRITPRSSLNDPFEVAITELTKSSLSSLDGMPLGESLANQLSKFMDGHGIVSLTETHDNLLMWSHYAENHKGLVVELDIDENLPFELFNSYIAESSDAVFDKVNYRKKRSYKDSISAASIRDISNHYYLTKSDEWIYEKEWRYIIPFTSENRVMVNTRNEEGLAILAEKGIDHPLVDSDAIFDASALFCGDVSIDPNFWHEVFINSANNGFFFCIALNEININKIFIGLNSNKDQLKEELMNNPLAYRSYWSPLNQKFNGIFESHTDPDKFELFFTEFK